MHTASVSVGEPLDVDVAIVGAGVAGCAAAAGLSKAGYRVALIDLHERAPAEFRAEKFGVNQMAHLDSVGLGKAAREHTTAFDNTWVHRYGRIIDRKHNREYASNYGEFVNGLRSGLPDDVAFMVGRIDDLETSDDRQRLHLADGREIKARLLVMATGLIDILKRKLGMERQVVSAEHSLTFGFDLANPQSDFPFQSLVWFLDRPSERGAYLTFFPIGDKIRANLFTYRSMADAWTKSFRLDAAASLRGLLPGLERKFKPVVIDGNVQARPIDLAETRGHERPGLVLLGDAFGTSCPVTGTGIDKALTDVTRLLHHVPAWLATPGMAEGKIAQFYADPLKLERDRSARLLSEETRSMRMDLGLSGKTQRLKNLVSTEGRFLIRNLSKPLGRRAALF
jgi:2-polyprenyl-6-methoxyphenol hydroxylase-like FAD-dependent oxidoreductase